MSEIRKVLSAKDISIAFGLESPVQVTDKVSFDIFEGEFFALVGESGCGKSVTAMSLLGLLPRPSAKVVSGEALLDGIDLLRLSLRDLQKVRGKKVSCIFQEPMQALDPVCTIKNQLLEVLREDSKESALQKIQDGLAAAGFADVDRVLKSYPCEMSGGMLQRISIVMALLPKPELIIADEPTTALDVTVQASVLLLLKKMAAESHTAVLLITHNMGLVSQYADRVAVMYAGRIVECGSCADVIKTPMHPYTQGLISAIPNGRFDLSHIVPIPGSVPSPEAFVSGCRFAARCPKADKECEAFPTRRGNAIHWANCFKI